MTEHEFGRLVLTTKLDLDDQCDRLNGLQLAMYDARYAFEALADGSLPEVQAQAVARLSAYAFENYVGSLAEEAMRLSMQMAHQSKVADEKNEADRIARAKRKETTQRACHESNTR